MGGGSTDASAVLIGLNKLWETNLSISELEKIGLSLGADVPFFIRGGLTRTRGIGEIIENHESKYNYWLIVIQPCPGLSTAQVFSLWHSNEPAQRPDTKKALHALETGDLSNLCRHLGNVLQPVSESLRPEIVHACKDLLSQGAVFSEMTGSGSAVFGVFSSRIEAEKAAAVLSHRWKHIHICHTQTDSVRISEE